MDGRELRTDLLIVGGGLAGSLLALALAARRPALRVLLVEAAPVLGGNHIWSFFDGDIASADRVLIEPLVCHHWSAHEVRFPGTNRIIPAGYNSITSDRLDAVVRATLPRHAIVTGQPARMEEGGAVLADGRRIKAGAVVDATGARTLAGVQLGWQKFLGRLLRLEEPHGLDRPTIMDATVDQTEGYRFVYLLPFDADRVFVEDTYYSVDPALDAVTLAVRIDQYAAGRGWRVAAVEREEAAALPIAIGGRPAAAVAGEAPRVGMAAGLFHPMTGYSLPDALRTAALVAALPTIDAASLAAALSAHAERRWQEGAYYRLLGRMLFHAADPADRWRVLARFYGLGDGLIGRFYAGQSTLFDKARILAGRPPVPLGRALKVLREQEQ